MPELPEVETIVRDLRPLLQGRTITGVRQSRRKLRRPWKPAWNDAVTGSQFEGLRRRGKWILLDLLSRPTPPTPLPEGKGETNLSRAAEGSEARMAGSPPPSREGGPGGVGSAPSPLLRVHLGMSGQFTVVPASTPEPEHLHVVFQLDNAKELRLRDQRRFGSAEYFADRAALEAAMNEELGPEPFGIDPNYFRDTIQSTRRNLKSLLLDQKVVAGVGNIYADEALFRAKLHPGREGKSLTPDECDRLRESIEAVLTRAIALGGSSFDTLYVGGTGKPGQFQDEFAVFQRDGKPCPKCETSITVARYSGRSSHFCGSCQPLAVVSRQPAKPKSKTRKRKSA